MCNLINTYIHAYIHTYITNSPVLGPRQILAFSDASALATIDDADKSLAGAVGRSI